MTDLIAGTIKEMRSAVLLARQFKTPVADEQLIADWANQLELGLADYRHLAAWCEKVGIMFGELASAAAPAIQPCPMCMARDCTCPCVTCGAARTRREELLSQGDGHATIARPSNNFQLTDADIASIAARNPRERAKKGELAPDGDH